MAERVSEQQRQALKMAASWYATFCAGDTTAQQHARWQQWLQQHEDHRWAWQRVESLQNQLQTLPGHLSYQTLNQANLTRRRVLKSLLVLLGVGSGWQLWQSPLGLSLRADYSTATGEMRSVRLSDGSQMTLNTASAVQVEFTGSQRTIHLQRGEIAITTAADAQQRPFRVATADGMLRALGTEFSVRLWPDATELSVQQHAVEATLADDARQLRVVQQGQTLRFSRSSFGEILPLVANSSSWTRGLLSVSNRPLGEVIAEVARYRLGMLICDDSAAELRVSGTFPLQDTDRLLAVLAQTLPIKIQTLSRYWVKVSAA
ncbi:MULTISPECIES: ferric citrate uptake sigma factor regulator FecR [Erwiniaceae]|uniref:ferric citrate uptake sigma factor regulator FecR n=1 Tax=Erwiniaceae TaxID=1903409 RepID=UPI00190BB252|nr:MULTISPECIES: ferric citrate uptake sigma factor regulator FecR [Erwiniaceae]MBK0002457.1 fec operon regulator FecR [Erwinia sp. S38]MBM7343468.1 transmembrane sensor [Pantoea coffeiphila]